MLTSFLSISHGNEPEMCMPHYPAPILQGREGFTALVQQYNKRSTKGLSPEWQMKRFSYSPCSSGCMKAWPRGSTVTATQKGPGGFAEGPVHMLDGSQALPRVAFSLQSPCPLLGFLVIGILASWAFKLLFPG